jgi:hypothetical protein
MSGEGAEEVVVDTRGQIMVPLEGQDFVLRPSFEAIEEIEKALGKSHEQLAHEAVRMQLTYAELGVICVEMMKAHARARPDDPLVTTYRGAKVDRVKAMIYDAGKARISTRIAVVLVGALSGGYTASGEPKATGETTEAIPVAD